MGTGKTVESIGALFSQSAPSLVFVIDFLVVQIFEDIVFSFWFVIPRQRGTVSPALLYWIKTGASDFSVNKCEHHPYLLRQRELNYR